MNYQLIKLFSTKNMPNDVRQSLNTVMEFMPKCGNFVHYTLYSGQYGIPWYRAFFILIDNYVIENGAAKDKNSVNLGETILLDFNN